MSGKKEHGSKESAKEEASKSKVEAPPAGSVPPESPKPEKKREIVAPPVKVGTLLERRAKRQAEKKAKLSQGDNLK